MGLFSSDKSSDESGHINVIAEIKAAAGHETEVRVMLEALVPKARVEDGCKGYHLLEDKKKTGSFYTYEEWTSEEKLNKHLESAKPMLEKAKALLDGGPKITVLTHIL